MNPDKRIAVVGTDTDCGKTVVCLLMMQYLFAAGARPCYIKPFQTGCSSAGDPKSDAAFVYRHTAALAEKDPSKAIINCHENPKAPFFAALDMGETIDLKKTIKAVKDKEKHHSHTIIEASGGLLVPVTEDHTIADFIQEIEAQPLVTARAGLGTINHTLLSVHHLMDRGMAPLGIIFCDAAETTDRAMVNENIQAVESGSGIQVLGVIGRIIDFHSPPARFYTPFELLFNNSHALAGTTKHER